MAIEVFCRYPTGATNAGERRVLWRAVDILERHRQSAVILCDFLCGSQQIDLLIATELTTLVLQVKSYRHAVEGTANSAFWKNPATGERLPNAYTQVTNQMLALKDMLRLRSGSDPGFARAVVLFEQGLRIDSSLPPNDFRVHICDLNELEALLLTHTSERSSRVPWDQAPLREFAIKEGMAKLPDSALRKPVSARSAVPSSPVTGRVDLIEKTNNLIDVQARTEDAKPTSLSIAPMTVARTSAHAAARSRQSRFIRRGLSGFVAILVVAGLGWFSRPAPRPAQTASANQQSQNTHSAERKRHRERMVFATNKSLVAPVQIAHATATSADIRAPSMMPGASSLPPCPAGIDRLGCMPSAQTLARLRGE
jgi:hypothetical protein